MVYISSWVSIKDIEDVYPELKKEPIFKNSPIFQECKYDEKHKEMLIKELIEHNYIICGDTHQSYDHNCVPLFNDGYLTLSMRTWGEVMAEAMNIKEHKEKYNYKDFYIASICKLKERIPGEKNV